MYGWILDGISSLFEHVTENNPIVWPGKGNVSEGVHTRPGVKAGSGQQENHVRPAKRKCQSVDDSIHNSDQVEVKRRRRDVVISFVKKTLVGVAGLLRLRNPLTTRCEKPTHYKETQPITLVGIDELHTSWLTSSEWRMNKPVGGMNDRGGKNLFQSSSPPLMRKYRDVGCLPSNISVNVQNLSDSSRAGLSAGSLDRGKDFERRGPLQLLPSRPVLRMGSAADSTSSGLGQCRFYKPSLTVEEAIKQNNKEHYRRLLEMVTEKYSKNQPLPFNQTKPQDESLSQSDLKTAAPRNSFESVSRKTGFTAAPHVFTWKNTPTNKDRRGSLPFSKTFSGIFEDTLPSKCTKKLSAEVDLSAEVATRLNLMDRETPAVSPPDILSAHSRHSGDDIPQLTREMAAEVSSALAQSDPNLVLSSAFKLRITQRDLATLHDGGWLNDEVINFYLSLIMERSAGQATELKVYSFSTFFFPKLWGGGGGKVGGHDAVKRWTKAIDLFSYDLILVPLHLGIHWAMAVIDFKSKNVMSYDSLGQRHDEICSLLLLYLKEEHRVKKGRELDSTKWTNGGLRPAEIPQQKNGSDCGVFACKYADYIAKGRPLTFKQYHMPVFRKLMIWEILNQKLL